MFLQRIQNIAAKIVLKKGRYDSVTNVFKELDWLPVRQKILHKTLGLVWKSLHEHS